jgi:exportin-1
VPAALAQPFFHAHLLGILKDVFGVLTDRLHKAHLKQQAGVLQYALALVEGGRVGVNLWECPLAVASGTAAQAAALAAAGTPLTNASFVRLFYRALVSSVFPNLQPIQVSTFVEGLFDQTKDAKAYKSHLVRKGGGCGGGGAAPGPGPQVFPLSYSLNPRTHTPF